MAQETFSSGWYNKKMSKYEIRQLQKKALQSYQQITSIKKSSDDELDQSIHEAENALEQFITSNKNWNGK